METSSFPLQGCSPAQHMTDLVGLNLVSGQRPEIPPGVDQAWPASVTTQRCCGLCRAGSCHLLPAPGRGGEVLPPCPVWHPRDQMSSPEQVTEIQFTTPLGLFQLPEEVCRME